MSVVADGREGDFQLRTKVDKVLTKSIITKEKAELTTGMLSEIDAPRELKDSKGILYSTRSRITLRCECGMKPRSFYETFYIVDSCELDALLRHSISQGQWKDESGCLPLFMGSQPEGRHAGRR
jgi:hypothetical protein